MVIKDKEKKSTTIQATPAVPEEAIERMINKGGGVASESIPSSHPATKEEVQACFSLRVPRSFVARLDALRKQKDVIPSRNQTIIEILEKEFENAKV